MNSVVVLGLLLALDGGQSMMTREDLEVVDNLELLQEFESAADLEVLNELAGDD